MKLKKTDCLVCDRNTKSHIYICDDCYSLLVPKKERVLRNFEYVDNCYSICYYTPFIRELIRTYKFGNRRYLSKIFSEIMIEKILELKLHLSSELIMSIPLFKDTLNLRGFNQVELIEDNISKILKINTSKNNLIKARATKEQARLNEEERKTNLINSFEIKKPEEIFSKRILLIDDMITTGATVDMCAKELKKFGAKEVNVLSIATTK